MPLEFIDLDEGNHPPLSTDRGFLVNLTRSRWNKNATAETLNLFRTFAKHYYAMKCPEDNQSEESKDEPESESKEQDSDSTQKTTEKIRFVIREMRNTSIHCFLACNLADPGDLGHYMFTHLAEESILPRPKNQYRILPVHRVCEGKAKPVEQTLIPLMDENLAVDSLPHRFTLIHRSHSNKEGLTHKEVMRLARNCIWAANPNCVQCLKYQDYAVVMETIDILLYIGVLRDFQKLGNYNTWDIRKGIDWKEAGPDSEDDISDDPTLGEEEEKRRKLRIKRKRRADRMEQSEKDEKEEEQSGETDTGHNVDGEDDEGDNAEDLALNGEED